MALVVVAASPSVARAGQTTLDLIKKRGFLICGVSQSAPGFSDTDERGTWSGLNVDFCAALAVSVFGRKDAVKYRPLTSQDRFSALRAGEVDVLVRSTTWTLTLDTEIGVRFAGVLFHDGQRLLVRRSQGIASALELSGATVCLLSSNAQGQPATEFFGRRGMKYEAINLSRWDDLVKAYREKRCSALAADGATLAMERLKLGGQAEHQILPEYLSRETLGPAVRQGDEPWFNIVRWTLSALIAAEEHGVTSDAIDSFRSSSVADVRRLLGTEGNLGAALGLSPDWAYQVVKQIGNYGEIFERNLGAKSNLRVERGYNNLWTNGGLMYAPAFR